MPTPTRLLLASALTLALHSTLHAATDIEAPTPGTGQDASASVTSSDPANTITATAASGAPNSNGGNATASATLTPTSDTISTLSATGGNGGDATFLTSIAGNGGNATISPITLSTTTANITLTASAKGGNGGNDTLSNALAGTGGIATLGPISATSSSGNITVSVLQTTGAGGTGATPAFNGIAPDSTLNNAISASTTGNITLVQIANASNGSIGGNATSILTLTNNTAASITARATAGAGISGTPNATISLTGNQPLFATASALTNSPLILGTANATINSPVGGSATATTAFLAPPTASSLGTATSAAYSANSLYPTYHTYASGINVPGFQHVLAYSNIDGKNVEQDISLNEAAALSENPTGNQLLHLQLGGKNTLANGTQTHTAGFDGTLDDTGIASNHIIFTEALFPFGSIDVDSLRIRFWIDNIPEIDRTFTNLLNAINGIADDFGPMSSFGPGPLDIHLQIDVTTHSFSQAAAIDVIITQQTPTPEPTSLSLLLLTTPLLLRRRPRTP